MALSSSSNARALSVVLHIGFATPEALTTAPPGASEPLGMNNDPSGSAGSCSGRITFRARISVASTISPTVLPDTVSAVRSIRWPSAFMTAGTPPAALSSVTPQGPEGASLTRVGVVRDSASQVSNETSTPALLRHGDHMQHHVGR